MYLASPLWCAFQPLGVFLHVPARLVAKRALSLDCNNDADSAGEGDGTSDRFVVALMFHPSGTASPALAAYIGRDIRTC